MSTERTDIEVFRQVFSYSREVKMAQKCLELGLWFYSSLQGNNLGTQQETNGMFGMHWNSGAKMLLQR